jgi:hypothetical protein
MCKVLTPRYGQRYVHHMGWQADIILTATDIRTSSLLVVYKNLVTGKLCAVPLEWFYEQVTEGSPRFILLSESPQPLTREEMKDLLSSCSECSRCNKKGGEQNG